MIDRNKSKDSGASGWAGVWDLPTRLFHWLLVLAVAIGALTGLFGPEWMLGLHAWSGYGLAVLILFRVIWGFFGSDYSRVESFTFPPRAVIRHLRGLIAGRAGHSIGHNPAGAAMIFALIGTLTGILATGLLTLGGQEKQGVLAGLVPYESGHAAKEIHEALTVVLLVLVALHVAGVVMESLRGPSNLIVAMITGRKRLPDDMALPPQRPAWPLAAMAALVVTGVALGTMFGALAALPPLGLYPLATNSAYDKECGACHYDFHPSLLPAASWAAMMAGLDDHFGENASLGDSARDEIAAWLATNAGERWDTEAANRFRKVSPDQPLRVTGTRYWKRRHRDIPEAVFKSRPVGGKVNCIACHRDARTGRFDDQSIDIPKEKP
jgi:cytochrome b